MACTVAMAAGVAVGQADLSSEPAGDDVGYLVSDERLFERPQLLWDGFLTGLEGFDGFYDPISNPIYHEPARIDTQLKFLYVYHAFPADSELDGGELNIVALQARVALTERFAFVANKDGYTFFNPGIFESDQEGFNDFSLGGKYAVFVDEETQFLTTIGLRYLWRSGAQRILQGTADEFSPFVSVAKAYGDLNLHGNLTLRIGRDDDASNNILQWSLHADYEILDGVAPVVEINGLHYLDDGDLQDLTVGGLDYSNIGASGVEGDTVVWVGVGGAVKLSPNFEIGATYEFPLTNPEDDILDERVTFTATFRY